MGEPSGWNPQYGFSVQSSASSSDDSPVKMPSQEEKSANVSVGNKVVSNDSDANESPSKPSSRDRKDSRSSQSRSRRSNSRHRRHRSRSVSRHRRRRSSSRGRRHRSRSNSRRRSNSRSRHRSAKRSRKDSAKNRSRSKSRSPGRRQDGENKNRPRDHRRRSRSRGRRSTSRNRGSRSRRSRSGETRRHRSRSREKRPRRSRSPRSSARHDSGSPHRFGYNRAMDAQERLARRLERAKELTKLKKEEDEKKANGFLGLKDDKLKDAIEKAAKMIAGSAPVDTVPHQAMSARATAQMTALRKQAEAETGIHVPTYYNPLVVNPMMYAQQQAKRNLLWSKKEPEVKESVKKEQSGTVWTKTSLGDEKSDEKFAKLMGIKQTEQSKANPADDEVKKRQELFSNLDMQYQQARVVTHTQRGAGLGFASSNPNTLLAQQAHQQLNPASSFPPQT